MNIPQEQIDTSYIYLSVKARIAFLRDFAMESSDIKGSVAELGVYRGDFAKHINKYFKDRKLFLFDTFEGFYSSDVKQDSTMARDLGERHFSNTSISLVLEKMPYPNNCIIKQGWFPESAIGLESETFCFVNLDCDLYEPILAGLRFFYPRMSARGVILIHEYFSQGYVGVREAVEEFSKVHSLIKLPIGDNLSIAIIKT